MKHLRNATWLLLVTSVFFLGACGGGGGDTASTSNTASTSDTGTLSLSMVDASDDSYQAVYVSIKEVQVCMETGNIGEEDAECEWETIATVEETFNLLTLVDGVMGTLGQKDLIPGTYNQMRLLLWDGHDDTLNINEASHPFPQYLIDSDGNAWEMKVPSGYESGIKLVSQFEIIENLTTELILDFDVARSVHKAGNNHKYILRPTIKVIGTHNRAVVSGVVTDDESEPLAGAQVSAWKANDSMGTPTSTFTNDEGAYTLYLDLGGEIELDPVDYTIVATANGHDPECTSITVEVDATYPGTDFELSPVVTVTVTGMVTGTLTTLPLPVDAPIVHISFKQVGECFIDPVETAFTTATDDGDENTTEIFYDSSLGTFQYTYSIDLPAGTYDVVASTDDLDNVEEISDFNTSVSTTLDIHFQTP